MASLHQLVMRTGPNPGTTFSLEGDQVTIGRDSTNTIVINDAEVSRRHARLNAQGGKYYIDDMGSTNGTFVNGQRLTGPYVLKSGDVISFGEQISLTFESLSYDPNATMMSGSAKTTMAAGPSPLPPVPARPVSQPQPQPQPQIQPQPEPQFVGQIPAGPAIAAAPEAGGSNRKWLLIVIALAVLFVICLCIAFFVWVDADSTGSRWCMILPFLAGCQ